MQGGDYRGKPAKLIAWTRDGETLYTRATPVHWATGADIAEAVMEQWIELAGDVAHIRFKFAYGGERSK